MKKDATVTFNERISIVLYRNLLLRAYLSTNVAELRDEAEDHVVLLVKRSLSDLVPEFVESKILHSCRGVEHLLADFRKLGNKEQDGDGNTGSGDG
jgi:hypothetical protein